jgi:hypothetical protein
MFNDDEPSKMFTFEEGQNQQPVLQQSSADADKQSQRSGRQQ